MLVSLPRLLAAALAGAFFSAEASEIPGVARYKRDVLPLLNQYCSDCHADGAKKGNVAFDEFKSDAEILASKDLWLNALKNVRAGLMPPEKKAKPGAAEVHKLEAWIKADAFGLEDGNPDPGRVTIRRLNRNDYRNTIRDLTGYDYKVEEELPPDDTGYGFDNIGDVLTMSPLLMEKYMQAAEQITAAAVPRVAHKFQEKVIVEASRRREGGRMSFYEPATVKHSFKAEKTGTYRLILDLETFGQFDFDPGETRVTLKADGKEVFAREFKWQSHKVNNFEFEEKWEPGEKEIVLELAPLVGKEKKKNSLELRLSGLKVEGPLEREHWVRPKNFDLFFTRDVPEDANGKREYAREVLKRFVEKAYRRPVDDVTVDRLTKLAESIYSTPGKKFEDGVAETMTPVLASPRFLFRIEETLPAPTGNEHLMIDEYALASRLSYFLWSTMPDAELYGLAKKGSLRKNLDAQAKRLLADARADAFLNSFVGQWLQVRDVDGIDVNVRRILSRDRGDDQDFRKRRERFDALREIPEEKLTEAEKEELKQIRASFNNRRNQGLQELDGTLRRLIREETEKTFAHIARDDRSVVELLDADYTFLNERLASFYGMTNGTEKVTGPEMRKVKLEKGSARGGVLTHASTLIVTSNPTRTSPVKRGLFVLDNILGVPPPPPPPDVPALEEEARGEGKRLSLRETLELHRAKPLCSSCHNRMDPLGFALENFNAIGLWRDKELGQDIDAGGRLVTGEEFGDIREVKRVLATKYRENFYRCLTEKMLTYALGRGLQYYDVETVDQIVARLGREDGRFSALLSGIIEAPAFQKRRNPEFKESFPPAKTAETRASVD